MGYNRINKDRADKKESDPLAELKNHLDGFILLAYKKGTHEKIALKHAYDQACADGLSFLDPHVMEWMELSKGTHGLSKPTTEEES